MIDKLAAVFPDARFIHIIRDGRAVLRSVIPLPWGPNTFYYGSQWWTSYVCAGLSAQSMNSISVTKVHYEDLVTDPESTLRDLCNDIGLKYQPEMPSGGGFKIPPYTRFQHKLVNRPVVNKLEQMGNELSSRDDEVFESVAGPIVRYLGYKTVFEDPRYPKFQERFFNGILEFARRVLNRVRQRARIRSLPK